MFALLLVASVLGIFSFIEIAETQGKMTVSSKIGVALGVIAFTSAMTIVAYRGGLLVALAVLVLAFLAQDLAKKLAWFTTITLFAPWVSIVSFFAYITMRGERLDGSPF